MYLFIYIIIDWLDVRRLYGEGVEQLLIRIAKRAGAWAVMACRCSDRGRSYEGSLENGEVTQFYFKKLKELEMSLALVISIDIFLIIVSVFVDRCRPFSIFRRVRQPQNRHCKSVCIFRCCVLQLVVKMGWFSYLADDADVDCGSFIKITKATLPKGDLIFQQKDILSSDWMADPPTAAIPLPFRYNADHTKRIWEVSDAITD